TQLGLRRQSTFAAKEAPGFHQRADRDVKCAVRLAAVAETFVNEIEELRLDLHRMIGGFAIETGERTLFLVIAHQPIDAIYLLEGGVDDARHLMWARPVNNYRIGARH